MYGIQVIQGDNESFGCIRYFPDGSAEFVSVEKSYSKYSEEYCCGCPALALMAKSRDSHVDALRRLFSGCGVLNIQDSGMLVPCTPSQCGGYDIFGLWLKGNMLYIENRTLDSQNRFAVFNIGRYINIRNQSIWYGYFSSVMYTGIMLRVVFSGTFKLQLDNDSPNWSYSRDFQVLASGIRNLSGGGEHFVGYKTAKEIMIGG